MKTIIVLGANGFVGTHISLALQKQTNIKLILACRDSSKLLDILLDEEIREGDLRDKKYLKSLFKGVDICINVASWSSLFGNEHASNELFLEPTLDVIRYAKNQGVKKYINLSTLSTASSDEAIDANSQGKIRSLWPHLNNVIRIEDHLRSEASEYFNVINLRCGLFIGKHYSLGLLPILLPRLKTHLVPLVKGGDTQMPLISGEDIAQAFVKAALSVNKYKRFEGFNILGKSVPKVKEVLSYINKHFNYPYPHFSVPFFIAYPFAYLMECLDPLMPFEPLVTRSIVHLLEDTHTNNDKARELLGYEPMIEWQAALGEQINEIHTRQHKAMKMHKEYK